jgi:2-polyprenyl-6-methoxyphenol hydroxylase-like FAD-dependent oxidoreductase
VLGDALHAMTPVGLGANCALQDAATLCKKFDGVNDQKSLVTALREYELESIKRGAMAVRMSQRGGSNIFGQKSLPEEDVSVE